MDQKISSSGILFLVEDDELVAATVANVLRSVDVQCRHYRDPVSFLASFDCEGPGCIVTDVMLPSMTGLSLMQELSRRGSKLPVIMLTGYADVDMAVSSFREGAFDFIKKPFSPTEFVSTILRAIERSRLSLQVEDGKSQIEQKLNKLTQREKTIMPLLMEGKSNKETARAFAISHRTVERYRQDILRKLGVRNIVELVNAVAVD